MICNDITNNCICVNHINRLMDYLSYIIDFIKNEKEKCKDSEYVYCLYLNFVNILESKIKESVSSIYAMKDAYKMLYNEFDSSLLSELKNKISI